MTVLRSIVMAFSMFSTIKMPTIEWSDKSMRYMLAAFPLVGVVIALLLAVWTQLSAWLGFDQLVYALGLTVIPILITGGIHIDGFSDTVDALASHAPQEKKRQILKDSHIGAFAAIGICIYLLCYFVLATQLSCSSHAAGVALGGLASTPALFSGMCVCLAPILSRTMSGIVSIAFPGNGTQGLLSTFRGSANKRGALAVLSVVLVACLVFAFACIGWMVGMGLLVVIVLVSLYIYVMSRRQFGGMSGDLSGFYLQVLELAFLVVFVIVEGILL